MPGSQQHCERSSSYTKQHPVTLPLRFKQKETMEGSKKQTKSDPSDAGNASDGQRDSSTQAIIDFFTRTGHQPKDSSRDAHTLPYNLSPRPSDQELWRDGPVSSHDRRLDGQPGYNPKTAPFHVWGSKTPNRRIGEASQRDAMADCDEGDLE